MNNFLILIFIFFTNFLFINSLSSNDDELKYMFEQLQEFKSTNKNDSINCTKDYYDLLYSAFIQRDSWALKG